MNVASNTFLAHRLFQKIRTSASNKIQDVGGRIKRFRSCFKMNMRTWGIYAQAKKVRNITPVQIEFAEGLRGVIEVMTFA